MGIFSKFISKIKGVSTADPLDWQELEAELLAADLGPTLTTAIIKDAKSIKGDDALASLTQILNSKLSSKSRTLNKVAATSALIVVGVNGTGKTTLIQMILNHEDGISISPKAKIGYFAQNGYKYNSNQNVLEFMQEDCDYNVSEIRSVLASMGFKQNDIGKSLSVLSGGEIIKLLLAKMLMGRYNILLMDEPSNFLDIPSLEALEILMKEYAGTIVFITHDNRLLDNVADVIYEIKDKKLNLVR